MALCAVCLTATSQNVPDYVPTEGLVAWYALAGTTENGVSDDYDGISFNGNFIDDRFGQPNSAAGQPGSQLLQLPLNPALLSNEFTVAFWVYKRANIGHNAVQIAAPNGPGRVNFGFTSPSSNGSPYMSELTCQGTYGNCGYGNTSYSTPFNEWFHMAYVVNGMNSQIFLNGSEISLEYPCELSLDCDSPLMSFWFGGDVTGGAIEYFNGDFDDIGIWSGTLGEEEILALYAGEVGLLGCTDPTACNFDSEATSDDGSCLPSGCMETEACNYNIEALCDDGICIYPPVVDLGGAVTLCEGQTVVLGVDASEFDVLWSNGSDSSSIEIGQTGTYWVQVGSANETDYRLEFDGVDDYVSFGNSLNITEYPFSIQLDATVSEEGFNIQTDDGTDGYSGVWMELNSTNMGVSVGSGWGGGPGQRRSKIASHGKQPGELVTVTAVVSGATDMSLYLDGVDVGGTYSGYGNTTFVDNGLDAVIGRSTASSGSLVNQLIYHTGSADNLHVWTKALTAEEAATFATTSATGSEEDLLALYTFDEGSGAVTVDDAQGFEATLFGNPTWVLDNIGCVASDTVAVYFIDCQNVCGPGTFWDETELSCLPLQTCQEDLDGDGVIGVNDLMQLLSLFGTDCEAEDVDPELGEFTCGDPMNYHGYDYATVQIGEQCWFAENLRTELYQNGDSIPGDLSNEDWFNTMLGAQATYNNDSASLVSYGRLYNWNAATDARYLCPSNWHVPADWEWQQLTDNLGGEPGSYPQVSNQLKSSTLNSPSWDGDNSSGFSAIPAGIRDGSVSGYSGGNQNANFWSSSNWGTSGWRRILYSMNGAVYRGYNSMAHGLSVRCLKDTE